MCHQMKKLITLLLLLSLLFLTACGHIEDTNGDDPSLVTIDQEKMTAKSLSHTSSGVSTRSTRKTITLNTYYEDIDVDTLEMSGGKISGVQNIMACEVRKGQTLAIACETGVVSGNLGVILLGPDKTILHTFTPNTYETYTTPPDLTGVCLVRIGAESFSGAIILERTITND